MCFALDTYLLQVLKEGTKWRLRYAESGNSFHVHCMTERTTYLLGHCEAGNMDIWRFALDVFAYLSLLYLQA